MDYTSSIEHISEVRKTVSVTVPADIWAAEVEKEMAAIAQRASVKGFRPGKAPRQMVDKMYGERVHLETVDKIVNSTLQEVLKQNSFSPVGSPAVEISSMERGQPLTYAAQFSIFPKPEVAGYHGLSVEVEKKEAADADIEQVMESIRRSKASLNRITERTEVLKGDVVEGELLAQVDGSEPPVRPEPFFLKIGDGRAPEELENGIVGMQVGETKEIVSALSEGHPDQDLRGKNVSYTITVKSISEEILPDVTDDFVKMLEGPEQTVLELRMSIRTRLEKDIEQMAREQVKSRIIEKLVAANSFEIPQELVDDEIRTIAAQRGLVKSGGDGGVDPEPFREQFQDEAERRVKAAILIDRIAELESLHAKSEDIDRYLNDMASGYGVGIEEVRKFYAKEGRLVSVFIEITRKNVLDHLADSASVNYRSPEVQPAA